MCSMSGLTIGTTAHRDNENSSVYTQTFQLIKTKTLQQISKRFTWHQSLRRESGGRIYNTKRTTKI